VRALDLYCCQGGMSEGLRQAGFEVVGVDFEPQPRYPFAFICYDAIDYLLFFAGTIRQHFDLIHASPPCQHDSDCQRIRGREHPDLIGPTREALEAVGVPYVIENVRGATPKLRDPVMLCGEMLGVPMYRHRYFETNWPLPQPEHPPHVAPQVKMGRAPKPGEYVQAVGNFSGVQQVREIMEMPWANRDGLREAVPAAYGRYVGEQFIAWRQQRLAA
jgi:DNA (cytosine-5)-methyltransferase 1